MKQYTGINKKISKTLKSAKKELSSFFNTTIKEPTLFLIDSRQEMDKIWGKKTKKWMTAWTKNNNIFILNPKIYTKESDHKNIKHFWQVIRHEYCHLYYKQITGASYPKWLNEGLACYLAGQTKKEPIGKEALKVFNYYSKGDWQIYMIGYFWVKFLIEKFGQKELLKLIKSINSKTTKKQFAEKFYQVYKFNYSKKILTNSG